MTLHAREGFLLPFSLLLVKVGEKEGIEYGIEIIDA